MIYQRILDQTEANPSGTVITYVHCKELISKTWLDFQKNIEYCADILNNLKADRIALMGKNSWSWFCYFLGGIRVGKMMILLDPLLSENNLLNQLEKTECNCLLYDDEIYDLETLSNVIDTISFRAEESPYVLNNFSHDSLTQQKKSKAPYGDIIIFTSGTLGNSKAVVIGSEDFFLNCQKYSDIFPCYTPSLLLSVPMHHIFSLNMLCMYLFRETIICLSTMKSFLSDQKIANCKCLTLFTSSMEYFIKRKYFSGYMQILQAGSPCDQEMADCFTSHCIQIWSMYAMTETAGNFTWAEGQDIRKFAPPVFYSCFVDEDQNFYLRLPNHFKEYYKEPDKTSERIQNHTICTGDLASIDEDGSFRINGRKDDVIVLKNGEKVLKKDFEDALKKIEDVSNAILFHHNGRLIAVLEVKVSRKETIEKILSGIRQFNLTQPMSLRIQDNWIYKGSFPYTSSGKLSRWKIEQEYYKDKGEI